MRRGNERRKTGKTSRGGEKMRGEDKKGEKRR